MSTEMFKEKPEVKKPESKLGIKEISLVTQIPFPPTEIFGVMNRNMKIREVQDGYSPSPENANFNLNIARSLDDVMANHEILLRGNLKPPLAEHFLKDIKTISSNKGRV